MENTLEKIFIYSLSCPVTKTVKYIGKAKCVKKRMYHHLNKRIQSKKNTKLANWLKKLFREGSEPLLSIIEVCGGDWQEREMYWISFYGKENLCNLTDGGEGKHGHKMSESLRAKISKSQKGKPKNYPCKGGVKHHSIETKNKISEKKKGVKIKGKTIVFFKDLEPNKIFNSITDASTYTNDGIRSISNNLKNKSKKN